MEASCEDQANERLLTAIDEGLFSMEFVNDVEGSFRSLFGAIIQAVNFTV